MTSAALLCGCPSDEQDDDAAAPTTTEQGTTATTAPPMTTVAATETASSDSATTSPTSTTATTDPTTGDPDSSGGFVFDLGSLPDSPPNDMGCTKVDFLFVIDNSGSMSAQQVQLLNSFTGFIDAIQMSLEGTVDSYHVGVITSDAYTANAPGCQSLGALVTQTQAGGVCTPFADGNRFATEADDLDAVFPCIGQVGAFGSGTELPVTATIEALSPALGAPGACNDGFLRDDAILVLVVLTDDPPFAGTMDDAHPMAPVATWNPAILAAKNDDPEALVVIGFVPWTDVSCVVFGIESPNLISFVQSFGDQGVIASICEPDFGPVFAQTVSTIVETCENFNPPAE
ncbi:MAG: hypothetical protein AB1Z98_37915 [Nannocystaceae bacterium]